MASVTYRETSCKTALTRVSGMPFEWSLNPYRGCTAACTYCYAREYHAKMDRDYARGFDSVIEVKLNFAEVLRAELAARRSLSGIALGTATDPYQAAEGRYRITRKSLEALVDFPTPLSIITKQAMIVRDIDLLTELDRRTRGDVRVHFSIGSVDPAVAQRVEPSAPPPQKRLEAMRRLRGAGIAAGVLCAPILPGLSDSDESLEAVALAAAANDASFFGWRVLKLDPHVKEYYFAFLLAEFPQLLASHRALYAAGAHAPHDFEAEIDRRVERLRRRYRLGERYAKAAESAPAQLTLMVV